MLKVGDFLQDRYEILEKIGSGGMSDVYKAKCHKLNRLVAIKVLKKEFCTDAGFVSNFKMEAQAAAGLSHPNIVNVYDVVDDGDIHYIVMELIEGITLKNYIAKKGCLDNKEAIGIAIQIAQGMMAAHERHIIHRDIKPQNIIISMDGKVKVADFGIAKAISMQTKNSDAIGSVHYIPPEQASGNISDARSDIYSFGITLYEMVTGILPFDGNDAEAVAIAHVEQELTPPSRLNSNIAPGLEKIILKCTRKNPDERYNSASQLINDLRHALLNPKEEKRENRIRTERAGEKGKAEERTRKKPEKDINKSLERLFSVGGIAGAIFIVAVLIFLIAQITGLFELGPGLALPTGGNDESRAESTIVLSDSQTNIPELLGITEDGAKARLAEMSLIPDVRYAYSETGREGYVISQDNAGTVVEKGSKVRITISRGSGRTEVESLELVGKTDVEAKEILDSNDISVIMTAENSDTVEVGRVIRTAPEDIVYKGGDPIVLYISSGPSVKKVLVPQLEGLPEDQALKMLEDAKLKPGDVEMEHNDMVDEWSIIRQAIPAGTEVDEGTAVGYVVSYGPEEVPVHQSVKTSRNVYVGSIDEEFDLNPIIGPGSGSTQVSIKIQLKQVVKGRTVYKTLMPEHNVNGSSTLSIVFPEIIGEYGVDEGEVEVVNTQTGKVLESYDITFELEE
ncbi:MAG: Stk1 family PASTA domain-containing Ser/Thr kinase [Lachnospiraceae bacterium]|jgi:serine/threonine protein kinase/beta-lactam-binding protein with PASTA domain